MRCARGEGGPCRMFSARSERWERRGEAGSLWGEWMGVVVGEETALEPEVTGWSEGGSRVGEMWFEEEGGWEVSFGGCDGVAIVNEARG